MLMASATISDTVDVIPSESGLGLTIPSIDNASLGPTSGVQSSAPITTEPRPDAVLPS